MAGDEGDGGSISSVSGPVDDSGSWWDDGRQKSGDDLGRGLGSGDESSTGAGGSRDGEQPAGSASPASEKSSSNSCLSATDILQLGGDDLLDRL